MSYIESPSPDEPRPRSNAAALVILAASALGFVVLAALAGTGGYFAYQQLTRRQIVAEESAKEKYREAAGAFSESDRRDIANREVDRSVQSKSGTPRDSEGIAADEAKLIAELNPLFEQLGEALLSEQADRIAPHIDVDRYVDAIVRQDAFDRFSRRELEQFRVQMRSQLARGLARNGSALGWNRFEIRRARALGDETLIVFVRHWDTDEFTAKFRWWVAEDRGRWRFYDFEDLSTGIRSSIMAANAAAATTDNPIELQRALGQVNQVKDALLRQDMETARTALQSIVHVKLPAQVESLRWMQTAVVRLHDGDFDEALEALNTAESYNSDMPILSYLRGLAYNRLGQYEQALQSAKTYAALLGFDADVYRIVGNALVGLERLEEAAEAYRNGLLDTPDSLDNFVGLAQVLPNGEKDELETFFRRFRQPQQSFVPVCDALTAGGDVESIELLVGVFRELVPDDPNAEYYDALVKYYHEQYDESARLSLLAIQRIADGQERLVYAELYLDAMLAAGKPLDGYHAVSNADHAFNRLVGGLSVRQDAAQLLQLVKAHRRRSPGDLLLDYYEGQAHTWEERYREAEEAYARGMQRLLGDELRESYRAGRVYARYANDQWLTAYRDIGPRRATFAQLAALHSYDEHGDGLGALVAAHRGVDPTDPQLLRWQVDVDWFHRRFETVVDHLTRYRDALLEDEFLLYWYEQRLIYSLVYVERFDEALRMAQVSTDRDGNPWHLIVVHAASGNVAGTSEAMHKAIELGYTTEDFYDDPIIGAALHREEFKELRERHPAPELKPPTELP